MSEFTVFLDRDGVINSKAPEGDYIKSTSELVVLPRVRDALRILHEVGARVFVVTNQRGVARGLMTSKALEEIHELIRSELRNGGGRIDGFYACIHDYEDACECRKPQPGLLIQAAREHGIDLEHAWMIGDRASDIEAGRNAGCRTVLVGPLVEDESYVKTSKPDRVAHDLYDAIALILPVRHNDADPC